MYAVIACMPSRGLPSQFAWAPIAMVTIIVSPIAREIPRITAAAIPERERHRVDGVLADRGHRRDDHHPHNESGGDRVEGLYAREEAVPEERGYERQGEVSVDHRWHAGQDLERRLEPPPQTLRGVLAEVDSREQSYGKRYGYGDDGRHQRAVDER